MRPVVFDARVWLPAVLAIGLFAFRAMPVPPSPLPTASPSIALPAMRGLPTPTTAQQWDLSASDSSVRFLVEGPRGKLLATCHVASGTLDLAAPAQTGELELRLDLTSLTRSDAETDLDVHHVLGVHRTSEVIYRGRLLATTSCDLPGVRRLLFMGPLHFDDRVVQQPMQLWQCSLPGQPMRLQGHGSVQAAAFGLPARTWLGLFPEEHTVTLGLDLAWRRRRAR